MRYYLNAGTSFGRVQIIGNTDDSMAVYPDDYERRQEGCHYVWGGIRVKINNEPPITSIDRIRELFTMLESDWWSASARADRFTMNRVTPPMAICYYLMCGMNSVNVPLWLATHVDTPDEVPPDMAQEYAISYAQYLQNIQPPQGENHAE